MDPRLLDPAQWARISQAVTVLLVFVSLALNGGLAFLLGHVALPSLAGRPEAGMERALRLLLYPVAAASALAACASLAASIPVQTSSTAERQPPGPVTGEKQRPRSAPCGGGAR